MTARDQFVENEEREHALLSRIAVEQRYGEQRSADDYIRTHAKFLRKFWRRRARISVAVVRERFSEYGNISDRICN
jgi:hypothetical protein